MIKKLLMFTLFCSCTQNNYAANTKSNRFRENSSIQKGSSQQICSSFEAMDTSNEEREIDSDSDGELTDKQLLDEKNTNDSKTKQSSFADIIPTLKNHRDALFALFMIGLMAWYFSPSNVIS